MWQYKQGDRESACMCVLQTAGGVLGWESGTVLFCACRVEDKIPETAVSP